MKQHMRREQYMALNSENQLYASNRGEGHSHNYVKILIHSLGPLSVFDDLECGQVDTNGNVPSTDARSGPYVPNED